MHHCTTTMAATSPTRRGRTPRRSAKPPARDRDDGAAYVGRRISRDFDGAAYPGTVDRYDARAKLWHVKYDDGDEEELNRGELVEAAREYDARFGGDGGGGTAKGEGGEAEGEKAREEADGPPPAPSGEGDDPATTRTSAGDAEGKPSLAMGPRPPSLAVPIAVAGIAAIVWIVLRALVADAAAPAGSAAVWERDRFLRETGLLMFQPEKYQGKGKRERYFEGWYYKFVRPLDAIDAAAAAEGGSVENGSARYGSVASMAVVPGIFYGDGANSDESHAFIFVTIDGKRQHYYRFDVDEFSYATGTEEYYIQVGRNRFSRSGVSLDLRPKEGDDADLALEGEISFENPTPWPLSLTKLGAMGPVGWIPGLECTHAVISFDHVLKGSLALTEGKEGRKRKGGEETEEMATSIVSFDDGRGYAEKDYGRSFPSLWIWIQTNSFRAHPGTSLFVSVARVPVFGMENPGFTAALWHDGTLIPFATWSGARFDDMRVSEEEVFLSMRSNLSPENPGRRMEVSVDRRGVPEVMLYAPVNFTRMAPFVSEALRARVRVRLFDEGGRLVLDDVGEFGGLEVHGDVRWLVDNLCGGGNPNKILCL
ncbi:hypothetical protein ACHAWF_009888 [Thalassiosira exigua]